MSEKHISIDRDQYEQQVAELCEARAKLDMFQKTATAAILLLAAESCDITLLDAGDYMDGMPVDALNELRQQMIDKAVSMVKEMHIAKGIEQ